MSEAIATQATTQIEHCGSAMHMLWTRKGWLKNRNAVSVEYRCLTCLLTVRTLTLPALPAPDAATDAVRNQLRRAGCFENVVMMIVVNSDTGCWEWQGSRSGGYGRFRSPDKVVGDRNVCTHRYVYELLVKRIPEPLVIDHLCRNRGCCNPQHLEAVTQRVNNLRSTSPVAMNHVRTHCSAGHPYDLLNTVFTIRNTRRCRACVEAWSAQEVDCPHCGKRLKINSLGTHTSRYCPALRPLKAAQADDASA